LIQNPGFPFIQQFNCWMNGTGELLDERDFTSSLKTGILAAVNFRGGTK
jgi:hypothetical protein